MEKGQKHTEKAKRKIREKALEQFKNGMPEKTKIKLRENAKTNSNFGMKGKKHTTEAKEKQRLSHIGKTSWNKGKVCPQISKGLIGREASKETRRNMSKSRKNGFKDGSIKLNDSNFKKNHKSIFKGKTYKEIYGKERAKEIIEKGRLKKVGKIKPNALKFHRSSEERKKRSDRMKEMHKSGKIILPIKDTKIEVKIQNFLKKLGIEFFTHQYMKISHGYQCDIFIPEQETEGVIIPKKTIIETDGCYWHGCPICNLNSHKNLERQKERDNLRTKELQEKGFRVIRLWEHEIRKMKMDNFQEILI